VDEYYMMGAGHASMKQIRSGFQKQKLLPRKNMVKRQMAQKLLNHLQKKARIARPA
jgi:hypothetical protein